MELLSAINNIRHRFANHPVLTFIPAKHQTAGSDDIFKVESTLTTVEAFDLLSHDLGITSDILYEDCNQLMQNFYSHVWDWSFIPKSIWNQLPYYSKYEIIRIRVNDLMKYSQIKNNNNNDDKKEMIYLPLLPMEWINEYHPDLTIEQYLIGKDNNKQRFKWKKNQYRLYGVDWNDNTKYQTQAMYKFLDENMVKKIHVLPNQHRNDGKKWDEFVTANMISMHFRFKINYFALKGTPKSDDIWVNQYIQNHFNPN